MPIDREERDRIFKEFDEATEDIKCAERELDDAEKEYSESEEVKLISGLKLVPGIGNAISLPKYSRFEKAAIRYMEAGKRFDEARKALQKYIEDMSKK